MTLDTANREVPITEEELKAFQGLEKSYQTMWLDISSNAPRCHMKPMFVDQAEDDAWWECSHCGHTKSFGGRLC